MIRTVVLYNRESCWTIVQDKMLERWNRQRTIAQLIGFSPPNFPSPLIDDISDGGTAPRLQKSESKEHERQHEQDQSLAKTQAKSESHFTLGATTFIVHVLLTHAEILSHPRLRT